MNILLWFKGIKWSMEACETRLYEMGLNVEAMWAQIDDLVVKTMISMEHQV
jgi:hypothetical protein